MTDLWIYKVSKKELCNYGIYFNIQWKPKVLMKILTIDIILTWKIYVRSLAKCQWHCLYICILSFTSHGSYMINLKRKSPYHIRCCIIWVLLSPYSEGHPLCPWRLVGWTCCVDVLKFYWLRSPQNELCLVGLTRSVDLASEWQLCKHKVHLCINLSPAMWIALSNFSCKILLFLCLVPWFWGLGVFYTSCIVKVVLSEACNWNKSMYLYLMWVPCLVYPGTLVSIWIHPLKMSVSYSARVCVFFESMCRCPRRHFVHALFTFCIIKCMPLIFSCIHIHSSSRLPVFMYMHGSGHEGGNLRGIHGHCTCILRRIRISLIFSCLALQAV